VESSRELDQRRKGYRSILGVVNAMKALSGANLRKGSSAVSFTRRYREFIESAASGAVGMPGVTLAGADGARLMVVFGSQFGFCGAFNARMVDAAGDAVRELGGVVGQVLVGRRLMDQAAPAEGMAEYRVDAPGSVEGLGDCISELLSLVYERYREGMFNELYFLYPSFEDEVMHTSLRKVLPPRFTPRDSEAEPPLTYISAQELMEGIIEEYLYIELYAAALEAVIAENEVRIRSMDFAARNIRKKLEELTRAYNYAHQEEVTNELIEIIGGYEASRKAAGE